MSIDETAATRANKATNRTGGRPWNDRIDLLGEIARDAELERSDFLVQATEQLRRFLDANRSRISEPRRHDAHRRGPGLPVDRARPDVPQPHPLPGRGHRGVGSRDRGHRVAGRAGRAVQPGRGLRGLRRGAREQAGMQVEPTAPTSCSTPASASRRPSAWASARTCLVCRRGRRLGARRADARGDDDETAARRLYDLALDVPGAQPASARRG